MLRFLSDPMAAGFIPLICILAFSLVMRWQLSRDIDAGVGWTRLLQKIKLFDPDTMDADEVIDKSLKLFRGLAILSGILMVVHGLNYYRMFNPRLFFAPEAVQITGEGGPDLPRKGTGAGGGGELTGRVSGFTPAGPRAPGAQGPGASSPTSAPRQPGQPGQVPPGQAPSGQYAPGQTPGQYAPGQAAPGQYAPGAPPPPPGAPGTGGGMVPGTGGGGMIRR